MRIPRGIIQGNPVFVMLLGLCPALAVTTTVLNAWVLGASVLFVLIVASVILSIGRRRLPPTVSPFAELALIALLVTVVEILMERAAPSVRSALGIYLPLSAVNCIILNQVRGSALKKPPGEAVVDAIAVGMGFLGALALIALFREVLGHGTITLVSGVSVRLGWFAPARVLSLPVGGLLVLGYLMALFNVIRFRGIRRKRVRDRTRSTTMEAATGGQQS